MRARVAGLVFLSTATLLGAGSASASAPTTAAPDAVDPAPLLADAADAAILLADGTAAFARGEQATALVALSKSLRAFRAAKDAAGEADALVALGRVHRALGRYAEATDLFRQALVLDRRLGRLSHAGADHLEIARDAALLGDHAGAARSASDAFASYRKAEDPVGAAGAAVDLGLASLAAGRAPDALEALDAAVALYEAAHDDLGLGDALTGRGSALARLGRYREAVVAYRGALDAYAALPDRASRGGRGAALHNLGNLYAELGDFERAAGLYRQARPLLDSPAAIAAADAAGGALLLAAGRAEDAVKAFREALDGAPERDRPGLLLNLGTAQREAGDLRAADKTLEQARASGPPRIAAAASLALGEIALDRSDPAEATKRFRAAEKATAHPAAARLRWRALHGLARASRASGGDPLPMLREAVALLEDDRRDLEALDPWAARRFIASRRGVYRDLIDALLLAGDGSSALLYSERLRVAELQPTGASGDPVEREVQAARERGRLLQESLEAAEAAGPSAGSAERVAALRTELATAREAFSRRVDELRTTYADFDRLVKVDPSDIEAYQRDLGDDEVVLQPILLDDRVAILVFTSGPLVVRTAPIEPEEMASTVGLVLKTMRNRRLARPEKLLARLDRLGELLWTPVAQDLEGKSTVIVVASGLLGYLPFQMLRREGRFLVQDHDVVNVTNVGSLKRRDGEALRLTHRSLLALGNPDGSLPAADAEIDALGALFPEAAIAHGADADLAMIRANAPGRRVLHLATHGVLDSEAPERSYIVLAGGEEGRLGYLGIPGLYQDLQDVELVVLSACESAVPLSPDGAVQGGGLEIAGLANQFRRAGVPRLLASLWQVGDESTRDLMVRFYRGLSEGRSRPQALAAAQRALIADAALAHPFHWAAFVLIGTPR